MLHSANRFHRRNHVNRVYKQGRSVRRGALSMKYRFAPEGDTVRFAVVVSKKVAKSAVVRNRIRRRVFEVLRHELSSVKPGFEGVVGVYDISVLDLPHKELVSTLQGLIKEAHTKQLQKS